MTISGIHILFWALLGIFTLASLFLACSSLINVLRLRNVRMSWKDGKMRGYPLFSTIFLGFTIVGLAVSLYDQSGVQFTISSLYLLLAGGWFTTSYLSSKRYITDHGIVKNVNEPSQTIAWYQIRDFVEQQKKNKLTFVFIYSEDFDKNPDNLVRLELSVPSQRAFAFKKLISHKLGRRISCYTGEPIRIEEFE